MKEQEIDHIIDVLVDLRDEIKAQIRTLPDNECDVLFRYYVLNQTLTSIAEERYQSVDWIKKLKWRGVSKMTVVQSEAFKETCRLLKIIVT
jgi:DNA-directed RNA polymerase specialized sigma subunit